MRIAIEFPMVGVGSGSALFDPDAPPRTPRPLRTGPPEVHHFHTSDDVELRLARYRGGDKGPVILCHGLGVSSRMFTLDTIDTNLVEFLAAAGYDVWLLDYRVSIELVSAAAQSNADTIATIDYPEAVAEVRRITGASDVQMVVHCFGATVFFISMLAGALTHVRSAVASQATPHVVSAPMVKLKIGARLPTILDVLGIDHLTAYTDTDAGWIDRLYNKALELYPIEREERCESEVCHRISFMYSTLYEHDQLADATHDTLHELFGVANMTTFKHIGQIGRAQHVVDADGEDVYLPHVDRLAIPIRLIHGAENVCFEPAGSEKTYEWLRANNDPDLYSRVVIPDMAHIDCIFGKRAVDSVFPHIVEHLDAT